MRAFPKPVFFYGTLLDADIRERVLGQPVAHARLKPAILTDHRAVFVRGRRYPMLEVCAGRDVYGAVFLNPTDREWASLCRYEGPEYETQVLDALCDGKPIKARVFQVRPQIVSSGQDWSFDVWRRRHKRMYLKRIGANAVAS